MVVFNRTWLLHKSFWWQNGAPFCSEKTWWLPDLQHVQNVDLLNNHCLFLAVCLSCFSLFKVESSQIPVSFCCGESNPVWIDVMNVNTTQKQFSSNYRYVGSLWHHWYVFLWSQRFLIMMLDCLKAKLMMLYQKKKLLTKIQNVLNHTGNSSQNWKFVLFLFPVVIFIHLVLVFVAQFLEISAVCLHFSIMELDGTSLVVLKATTITTTKTTNTYEKLNSSVSFQKSWLSNSKKIHRPCWEHFRVRAVSFDQTTPYHFAEGHIYSWRRAL